MTTWRWVQLVSEINCFYTQIHGFYQAPLLNFPSLRKSYCNKSVSFFAEVCKKMSIRPIIWRQLPTIVAQCSRALQAPKVVRTATLSPESRDIMELQCTVGRKESAFPFFVSWENLAFFMDLPVYNRLSYDDRFIYYFHYCKSAIVVEHSKLKCYFSVGGEQCIGERDHHRYLWSQAHLALSWGSAVGGASTQATWASSEALSVNNARNTRRNGK